MTADLIRVTRALISVSDKTGLIPFGQALAARGVEILSTGGSAQQLRDAGVPVTEVGDHTGFPEMMDGRVKTLHPRVHGGILARRRSGKPSGRHEDPRHPADRSGGGQPLSVRGDRGARRSVRGCVENIDIGGPAMIRSAAKNHGFVAVLTDASEYEAVLAELEAHDGATSLALRRRLAASAYARTAAYDAAISQWFAGQNDETFPARVTVAGSLRQTLRYGENPIRRPPSMSAAPMPGPASRPRPSFRARS